MGRGFFDDQEISIPCQAEGCGCETPKTVAWLKRNDEFTCPYCGTVTALERDKFLRKIKKAEDDLGNFGCDIRIDL